MEPGIASCTDLRALPIPFDHAIAIETNRHSEIRLQSFYFKSDNSIQLEVPGCGRRRGGRQQASEEVCAGVAAVVGCGRNSGYHAIPLELPSLPHL